GCTGPSSLVQGIARGGLESMTPLELVIARPSLSIGLRVLVAVTAFMLCVLAPATARAQAVVWTLRTVSGPPPRAAPAMVYDVARGVTVLFGGANLISGSLVPNGETWEWNGTVWAQRVVSGPSP